MNDQAASKMNSTLLNADSSSSIIDVNIIQYTAWSMSGGLISLEFFQEL